MFEVSRTYILSAFSHVLDCQDSGSVFLSGIDHGISKPRFSISSLPTLYLFQFNQDVLIGIEEDDIIVYNDKDRTSVKCVFRTLRQQTLKPTGMPNVALSDFIAPAPFSDYIGGFAVTTGIGVDEKVRQFENDHDDYSAIMLKALADRLAEAFAELMHLKVRKELWGYSGDETLSPADLINEKYQGIRPAPGYPAQPDHTEKKTLFELLDAENNADITLTESMAMHPAAAVSGLYFSHPFSSYFGLGKINAEQMEDYAVRKKWHLTQAQRWLAPVIV